LYLRTSSHLGVYDGSSSPVPSWSIIRRITIQASSSNVPFIVNDRLLFLLGVVNGIRSTSFDNVGRLVDNRIR